MDRPELRAAHDGFLAHHGAALWPEVAALATATVRRATLTAWLDDALAAVDDEIAAARLLLAHPRPGADRHAWRPALLTDPSGPTLLTRPRPDGDGAVVELVAWDRPLLTAVGWEAVVQRALAAHVAVGAHQVRLPWPGTGRPPLPPERTDLDGRVLAVSLRTLTRRRRPWGWTALEVRPATDLSWLPRYQAALAAWAPRAGRLGALTSPLDAAGFQRCLDSGAVVCAWAGPTWLGVAAAEHAPGPLFDGYRVRELLLTDVARGHRRAPVLARQLVEHLVDHGTDAVWCQVPRANAPAERTARRVGAEVVQTWWRVSGR